MTSEKLNEVLRNIEPLDPELMKTTRARIDGLIKPLGSLGELEDLAVRLSAITGQMRFRFDKRATIVMAADHGITEEGVSAAPRDITWIQTLNMTKGITGVCAFAKEARSDLYIVDIGVDRDLAGAPIHHKKVRRGTANFTKEAAMTREEARRALVVGIEMAEEAIGKGAQLVAIGEMGIGNTTPATAVIAALTGAAVCEITGLGANLPAEKRAHKIAVIEKGLALHHRTQADPLHILSCVGGLDIAGMAGVILGAAAKRVPVIIDGVIAAASALIAAGLSEYATAYMIASHASAEPAAGVALEHLGLKAPIDLGLRLGEGTGAVMMMPLVDMASAMMAHMITFEEAGFSLE